MKCPACNNDLKEMSAGDITVDACVGGCGGIWFDRFELQKVDEPHESAGEGLLDIEKASDTAVDHEKKRQCPRCEETPMMRHFYSVKRDVEVDECPKCAGFWLDYGELGSIRENFSTDDDRKEAAAGYFKDIFDVELIAMQQESEEKRSKAQRIAGIFRFICPSYYKRGKQEGAAF